MFTEQILFLKNEITSQSKDHITLLRGGGGGFNVRANCHSCNDHCRFLDKFYILCPIPNTALAPESKFLFCSITINLDFFNYFSAGLLNPLNYSFFKLYPFVLYLYYYQIISLSIICKISS